MKLKKATTQKEDLEEVLKHLDMVSAYLEEYIKKSPRLYMKEINTNKACCHLIDLQKEITFILHKVKKGY